MQPESLKSRLQSDLNFSHHRLRKDFKELMNHYIRLSEAFKLVDWGPKSSVDKNRLRTKSGGNKNKSEKNSSKKADKQLPVCLYASQKSKGFRQFIRDYTILPDVEKKALLKDHAEERERNGPARNTRSQTVVTFGRPPRIKRIGA